MEESDHAEEVIVTSAGDLDDESHDDHLACSMETTVVMTTESEVVSGLPPAGHDYSQMTKIPMTDVDERGHFRIDVSQLSGGDDDSQGDDETIDPHDSGSDIKIITVSTAGGGGDGGVYATGDVPLGSPTHVVVSPAQAEITEVGSDGPYCLVCSDKGSGYHYSVYSCEGCKGFFKRSVQKNLSYTCKENQDCAINKFTRNNCQYCRLTKCMAVGMKKEAVREDRAPGGKHRHKKPRLDGPRDDDSLGAFPIATVMEPMDEALTQRLVEANPNRIPGCGDIFPGASNDFTQLDINDLMQYGYMELRMIIEWARKVPGFADLLIEDQMALLKASFMELNVLRLAFRSLDCDGGVKFAQSLVLTQEQCMCIGWGKDLVNYTREFIALIKGIDIDVTEFCILNAVVLTYPDAAGVQDREQVIELQSKFLEALRKYSTNSYPSDPRRYARMLLRIPALRSVGAKAAERFLSMSLDGSIKMNSLVLEMMS